MLITLKLQLEIDEIPATTNEWEEWIADHIQHDTEDLVSALVTNEQGETLAEI